MSAPEVNPQSELRRDLFVIALTFALAMALRLYRLTSLDVWFDEVALLLQTKMSFAQIWTFCKDENFPPLYGWILKAWSFISPSDNWLRFLSTLLGSLIPPAAYLLGKEIYSRKLGVLLSFICLLSSPLLFYSQIIRMYSLWVLLSIISYLTFIRALKTGQWKYWIILAAANLLGFYTFLFTVFIIEAEAAILVFKYRLHGGHYRQYLVTHLPAFVLMMLWITTLLFRYEKVYEYVPWRLTYRAVVNVGIYFGTGTPLGERLKFVALMNLPFFLGLLLGIPKWRKNPWVMTAGFLFLIGGGIVAVISTVGHSMFFGRYLLFIQPLYMALALFGWLTLPQKTWRVIGISAIYFSLLGTYVYHRFNYMETNDAFRYVGQFHSRKGDDGRCLSRTAKLLEQRLRSDEVIIHYSTGHVKLACFGYFPAIYYHNRALPEYVYSPEPVPLYCGGQYLKPGEWLKSLQDFKSLPMGIWLQTWDEAKLVEYGSTEYRLAVMRRTFEENNFPEILYKAGYRPHEEINDGSVTLVHFLLEDNNSPATGLALP